MNVKEDTMEYECRRCGFKTMHKHVLLRHFERQNVCVSKNADVCREELLKDLQTMNLNEVTYACEHCDRKFNSRSSKSRHLNTCKKRMFKDAEIERLHKEIEDLKSKISSSTVNNITNNNTIRIGQIVNENYIHINNYGAESFEHIPLESLTHYFMMKDIPSLIKNIHFDQECHENRNILLKSVKHGTSMTYQDGHWVVQPTDIVVNQLVDKGQTVLKKHYRRNKDHVDGEMNDEEVEETLLWLADIFHNKKKALLPLKKELLALLENYRFDSVE